MVLVCACPLLFLLGMHVVVFLCLSPRPLRNKRGKLFAQLVEARERGERVLLFAHVPLCRKATKPMALLWNHEEVMQVLREEGGSVVAPRF